MGQVYTDTDRRGRVDIGAHGQARVGVDMGAWMDRCGHGLGGHGHMGG